MRSLKPCLSTKTPLAFPNCHVQGQHRLASRPASALPQRADAAGPRDLRRRDELLQILLALGPAALGGADDGDGDGSSGADGMMVGIGWGVGLGDVVFLVSRAFLLRT